jgi:hypothetical protein
VAHPVLGHVTDPALPDVDEHCFRNQPQHGPIDLVALGDSQTYGFNVESADSWPQVLGRQLDVDVYNLGIGAYGILQYQHLIERAIELDTKYIVLGLYLANNLDDICRLLISSEHWRSWAQGNGVDPRQCPDEVRPPHGERTAGSEDEKPSRQGWMRRNLALVSLIDTLRAERSILDKIEGGRIRYAIVIDDGRIRTIFKHARIQRHAAFMDLERHHIATGLDITKEFLRRADEATRSCGISFLVLFIPSKERVFARYLRKRDVPIPEDYSNLVANEDRLKTEVSTFLADRGTPFADLLPPMERGLEEVDDLYPARADGHPLAAGYRIYAQAAFELIGSTPPPIRRGRPPARTLAVPPLERRRIARS